MEGRGVAVFIIFPHKVSHVPGLAVAFHEAFIMRGVENRGLRDSQSIVKEWEYLGRQVIFIPQHAELFRHI